MADEVAELKVKITGDTSDLERAINGVERELAGVTDATTKATDKNTSKTDKNTQSRKRNQRATEDNAKQLKALGTRYKDAGDAIDRFTKPLQRSALALAAGGVAAAKFAIDFEDNFAAVTKTVEGTPAQLEKVKQGIIDLTTVGIDGRSAIPQTTAQLTELAAAGGQLGIETDNIVEFTETMAQLGTATNLAGEAGAQTLARFMNVANVEQENIRNLGSAIVDLGNNFATTEAEIADMALNLGATGATVGMSAQDVLAYATALSSMGVEAEAGGSAVSRIWMSIQTAVSTGGEALQEFSSLSGKSADQFKEHWKKDASGAFRDFLKGLNEADDQIAVLEKLGFNNIRDIQALQRLAGEKGFGLLTEAIQRSNEAWEENTALQTEFDAKANTTASQIQIMKNNLVEAGRSIGETFLPFVADATNKIKDFAQYIAQLDDGQKKNIITLGKWVIGLGVASKAVAGGITGFGNLLEAIGKIKGATAAGGALAKLAPALTGVASTAGTAAIAVAGIGTAIGGAYLAYQSWYKANYKWADGMEESAEKVKNTADAVRELGELGEQIQDLKLIIESDQSSKEDVDNAKGRLEEIKKTLRDKYSLVIETDATQLDDAIEKVRFLKDEQRNELIENSVDLKNQLSANRQKFNSSATDLNALKAERERWERLKRAETTLNTTLNDLTSDYYTEKTISYDDFIKKANDAYQEAQRLGTKHLEPLIDDEYDIASILQAAKAGMEDYGKEIDKLNPKISDLEQTTQEYVNSATSYAETWQNLLRSDALLGDSERVTNDLSEMAYAIKTAKLDTDQWAQSAALAMNGLTSLDEAWSKAQSGNGEALDNMVNDYIRASTEFGAMAQQTAVGASLLKNGFRSIDEAVAAGSLDVVAQQANEVAKSLEGMPDNTRIEISAEGDVSLIDEAQNKVIALQKNGEIGVSVKANGDVAILDQAGNEINYLKDVGAVSVAVNADGNIDILNQANQVIGVIPKEVNEAVNVHFNPETGKIESYSPDDKDAKVNYSVNSSKVDKWKAPPKEGTVTYRAVVEAAPNAKGTRNFQGGFAVINDQKGTPDPRELVEVGGKGYLFEGRDVVLPLPKHAKVYTAAQTKHMVKDLPHFAKGKDNEAWEAAQDDWRHYTSVNIVSPTEQLAHWNEMLREFAYDAEVVKEIQEEIFSVTQQLAQQANEVSENWLSVRVSLNDWEEIGDTMGAAYARVMGRNSDYLKQGVIDFEEYQKTGNETFEQLLTGYLKYSDDWISNQQNYFAMSAQAAAAARDRQLDNIHALADAVGELTDEQYALLIDIETKVARQKMDDLAAGVDAWRDDADWYRQQSEVYGWGFQGDGDTEMDYLKRRLNKEIENSQNMGLSDNERKKALREADLLRMDIYKLQMQTIEDFFGAAQEAIDDARAKFDEEEQALRDGWAVADRKEDKADILSQMDIYKYAATKEGKDKYEQLQAQLKQIERDEQMYALQEKNNATIERMEAELAAAEDNKKEIMAQIQQGQLNMDALIKSIDDPSGNGIGGMLNQILGKLDGLGIIDNRQFTQNNYNNVTDKTDAVIFGNTAGRSFTSDSYGGI